jgi:hypothetical protein
MHTVKITIIYYYFLMPLCNSEISLFSLEYGLPCASKYISCYLMDFWFHIDAILQTFGFNGHSAVLDPPH